MAFEYGFYNSINSDRKYNAIQFGQIFDGIINDGVFLSIGEKFTTLAAGGMDVTVGTGKAWFNHTWNLNTTKMPFTLDGSHPVLSRYDAIILEVNDSPDVYGRVNCIKVLKGEPSSNAVKPTLVNDQYIHQYPLSYIKINAGVTSIVAADIEIMVGRDPCPYVTGILQTTDITELYDNWENQFTIWFDNLKAMLNDNIVANLQAQIDNCLKPSDIATDADMKSATAKKLVDASKFKTYASQYAHKIGDILYSRQSPGDLWMVANGRMLKRESYPDYYNINFATPTDEAHAGVYRTTKIQGPLVDGAGSNLNGTFFDDDYVYTIFAKNSTITCQYQNLFTDTIYSKTFTMNTNAYDGYLKIDKCMEDGSITAFICITLSSSYSVFRAYAVKITGDPTNNNNWKFFTCPTEFTQHDMITSTILTNGILINSTSASIYIYGVYNNALCYCRFAFDSVNNYITLSVNRTNITLPSSITAVKRIENYKRLLSSSGNKFYILLRTTATINSASAAAFSLIKLTNITTSSVLANVADPLNGSELSMIETFSFNTSTNKNSYIMFGKYVSGASSLVGILSYNIDDDSMTTNSVFLISDSEFSSSSALEAFRSFLNNGTYYNCFFPLFSRRRSKVSYAVYIANGTNKDKIVQYNTLGKASLLAGPNYIGYNNLNLTINTTNTISGYWKRIYSSNIQKYYMTTSLLNNKYIVYFPELALPTFPITCVTNAFIKVKDV